MLVLYVFS